jgi:hypothetical protein
MIGPDSILHVKLGRNKVVGRLLERRISAPFVGEIERQG